MGHHWLLLVIFWLSVALGQESSCRYSWYVPSDGKTYTLGSPNYPRVFRPTTTCYWYLYTDSSATINLNCHDVNLQKIGGFFCRDTISVYGSNADTNYCDPFDVFSLNHKILISLQPSMSSPGGSFFCTVRTIKTNCDCGWSYRLKVVNGDETGVNEFPSMVALVDARKGSQVCGATIISPRFVVTAAHCLQVLQQPVTGVLVGEHDLTTGSETSATMLYRAKRFVIHPGWTPRLARNDIGLVETSEAMQFSARVGPACLPFNRPSMPQVGDQLTVLGWGTTSFGGPTSDVLRKANLRVVPINGCQAAFNMSRPTAELQICTYESGKDSCQMDSGGPLLYADPEVSRLFLAGVVSYGAVCAGDDPAVSTRVYPYLTWITSVTQENFCTK